MKTNISFKSNIFLFFNSDKPYNDWLFIEQIVDPVKLYEIEKNSYIPNAISAKQKSIMNKFAVCYLSKEYTANEHSQYFILKGNDNEEICKCPFIQCSKIRECRPYDSKEKIVQEKASFDNLNKSKGLSDTITYYPIVMNFYRLLERYDYFAYEILSNTDLRRYRNNSSDKINFVDQGNKIKSDFSKSKDVMENSTFEKYRNKYFSKISYKYEGDGNGSNWDNWINMDTYFTSDKKNQIIPDINVSSTVNVDENIMFKYQREHNLNKNNNFFKNNKIPY